MEIPQRERVRILRKLDVESARTWIKTAGTDEVILAAMHKARVGRPNDFSPFERSLSKQWLRTHGYVVPESK